MIMSVQLIWQLVYRDAICEFDSKIAQKRRQLWPLMDFSNPHIRPRLNKNSALKG